MADHALNFGRAGIRGDALQVESGSRIGEINDNFCESSSSTTPTQSVTKLKDSTSTALSPSSRVGERDEEKRKREKKRKNHLIKNNQSSHLHE